MNPSKNRLCNDEQLIYQPTQIAETAAWRLYEEPDNTEKHVTWLQDELSGYCTSLGLDKNNLHVRHKLNRAMHTALSAPIFHMIEIEADRRFLDAFDCDAGLDIEEYTAGLSDDHTPLFPFEGEYLNFIKTSAIVDTAVTGSVIGTITQDPGHPYRPLWDAYAAIVPEFAKTEQQVRGFDRPNNATEAIRCIMTYLSEESTIRPIMHYAMHVLQTRPARGPWLMHRFMTRAEELAWAASTTRHFIEAALPQAGEAKGTSASCPFALGRTAVFLSAPSEYVWARPNIMTRPQEVPGFCPANIELRPPTQEAQQVLEGVMAIPPLYTEMPRHYSRLHGTASAAELNLIRNIALAGKTLLRMF